MNPHGFVIATCVLSLLMASSAASQQPSGDISATAPRYGRPLTQKVEIGLEIAAAGACRGIVATMPVPMDWPEQKVELLGEDLSPHVKKIQYRTLGSGAKQMVVTIPQLPAGQTARAVATFEVTRSWTAPPVEVSELSISKKVDRDLAAYLGPSPFIESRHAEIKKFAGEIGPDLQGWKKVEAIYDAVRKAVSYKFAVQQKGALKALEDGTGDCEELTALFVAASRASGIPARSVWVHGHCYPEFYLVDREGNGHWYPCQAAGARSFGEMREHRPILQKGDNFKDPTRPREKLPYVNEHLAIADVQGDAPTVRWIPDRSKTTQTETQPAEIAE